jgi:uncharacterized protein YaaN involved in tellurite resistance
MANHNDAIRRMVSMDDGSISAGVAAAPQLESDTRNDVEAAKKAVANAVSGHKKFMDSSLISGDTFNVIKSHDAKDSQKFSKIYDLHEKYENFGEDAIKDLLPDISNKSQFDISMGELGKGSEANKNIGKTLTKMSNAMNDIDARKILHRPENKLLRAVYDPVRSFFNKTRKAGAVIEDCMKTLTKYEFSLRSDIAVYKEDRVRALKCVEAATQQASLAGKIIEQLRTELSSGKFNADPEIKEALESEVLNTLERRRSDLINIAAGQTTYIASIDLLAKTHWKMIEQVKSTKNTAVIRLKSAVQLAHGIYVQETARKAVLTADAAAVNLNMDNAVNLKDSVDSVNKIQESLHDNVENMQATLNTIISAHQAFKDAEKNSVEFNHDATERMQKQLDLLNKTLMESKILDDTRTDLINTLSSKVDRTLPSDGSEDSEVK